VEEFFSPVSITKSVLLIRGLYVFELRIAENYVPKSELSSALERVEAHMIRIENKLDALVNLKCD